jgi:hypothetical protein
MSSARKRLSKRCHFHYPICFFHQNFILFWLSTFFLQLTYFMAHTMSYFQPNQKNRLVCLIVHLVIAKTPIIQLTIWGSLCGKVILLFGTAPAQSMPPAGCTAWPAACARRVEYMHYITFTPVVSQGGAAGSGTELQTIMPISEIVCARLSANKRAGHFLQCLYKKDTDKSVSGRKGCAYMYRV